MAKKKEPTVEELIALSKMHRPNGVKAVGSFIIGASAVFLLFTGLAWLVSRAILFWMWLL